MKKITVITAIVLLTSVQSFATPIYGNVTMSYTGEGAYDTMTIWGGGWNGLNVYAGTSMFNKTAGSDDGQYIDNGPIGVFCIDLLEYIAPGSLTYDVIMPEDGPRPTTFLGGAMGQAKADYLSELWGRHYDPAWATNGSHTVQQNKQAEAFAASVWEIVYENTPTSPMFWDVTVDSTLGSKGFRAANLDYVTANNWLHSLNGTGTMANLRALSYIGSQDFIIDIGNNTNIPEPASLAFFSVVGFVLAFRDRKAAINTSSAVL